MNKKSCYLNIQTFILIDFLASNNLNLVSNLAGFICGKNKSTWQKIKQCRFVNVEEPSHVIQNDVILGAFILKTIHILLLGKKKT